MNNRSPQHRRESGLPLRISSGCFANRRYIGDRQQIAKEVIEIGDREKHRIATDLHDELCQDLAAASLISRLLEKRLGSEGSPHASVAGQIATMVKDLAVTARNLVHNLAPVHLAGDGFVEVLQRTANGISMAFPVKCTLEGRWPERFTNDAIAIQLYRIVHEAMHNCAKHSGGNRITVCLLTTEKAFRVSVADNGAGFKPGNAGARGIGLSTMEYRAGLIGATLKIDSVAGRGSTVTCELPL
jgi:signal transduction histidine kinase